MIGFEVCLLTSNLGKERVIDDDNYELDHDSASEICMLFNFSFIFINY